MFLLGEDFLADSKIQDDSSRRRGTKSVATSNRDRQTPDVNDIDGRRCVRFSELDSVRTYNPNESHAKNPSGSVVALEPESIDMRRRIQQVARFIVSRPDEVTAESEMMSRQNVGNSFLFMHPNDRYYAYYEEQKHIARDRNLKEEVCETKKALGDASAYSNHQVEVPDLPSDGPSESIDTELETIRPSSIGRVLFSEPVACASAQTYATSDVVSTLPHAPASLTSNFIFETVRSIGSLLFSISIGSSTNSDDCVESHAISLRGSPVVVKRLDPHCDYLFSEPPSHSISNAEFEHAPIRNPLALKSSSSSSNNEHLVTLASRFEELPSEPTSHSPSNVNSETLQQAPTRNPGFFKSSSKIREDMATRDFHLEELPSELPSLPSNVKFKPVEHTSVRNSLFFKSMCSSAISEDCFEPHVMSPLVSPVPVATMESQLWQVKAWNGRIEQETERERVRRDRHKFQFYEVLGDHLRYDIEGSTKTISPSFRTTSGDEDDKLNALVHEHLERDHEQRTRVRNRMFNTSYFHRSCASSIEKGSHVCLSLPGISICRSLACCRQEDSIVIDVDASSDSRAQ